MAGFSSTIRFDPDHAPAQKPLGAAPIPQIGGGGPGAAVKHVANNVPGPTSHLGAFGGSAALKQGHMKI